MKPGCVRWLTACVLASCLPSLPAAADILIEAHATERPADADSVLATFRAELATAGVKVRAPDIVAAAADQLPLAGGSDLPLDEGLAAALKDQAELGTKQVLRGDYAPGLATLEAVLARVRANPAQVVVDASAAEWLTKAYAAIAFAQLRSQRVDAANEAIAEQIRSFPDRPIGRIVGPQVATLADQVRKRLDGSPQGKLQITVSQPDVQIFLDERARGAGSVFGAAIPGTYRLLLLREGASRRYLIRVLPERLAQLAIDWDADVAFTVAGDVIGFVGLRDRANRVAAAATRYARGGRQHDVIVASLVERSGRRYLDGAIFEKNTGVMPRHKVVALGTGDDACKRALAQYLLRGTDSPCLLDLPADAAAPPARSPAPRPTRDVFARPGLIAGVGAIAVIGGATLMISKQDSAGGEPGYFSWPGASLLVGGGLALGAATLWASRLAGEGGRDADLLRHSRVPVYVAASTAAAAVIAGGYLLSINGNGTCGGERPIDSCPYRYQVAGQAWAFIGAGVAAAGFGVYWHLSAPSTGTSAVVGVSPTSDGAIASVRGSF